jgi:hypothetical protein
MVNIHNETSSGNKPLIAILNYSDKGDNAWTTRFAITGADGKLSKPEHSTQPDGKKTACIAF